MAISDNITRLIDIAKRLRKLADRLKDVDSKSQIIDELFKLQEVREEEGSVGDDRLALSDNKLQLQVPDKKTSLIRAEKAAVLERPDTDDTYTFTVKEEPDEAESKDSSKSKKAEKTAVQTAGESGDGKLDVESAAITKIDPPSAAESETNEAAEVETFEIKFDSETVLPDESDTVVKESGSKRASKRRKRKVDDDDEPIEVIEEDIEIIEPKRPSKRRKRKVDDDDEPIEVIEEDIEIIEDEVEVIEDDFEIIEDDIEIIEDDKVQTKEERSRSAEIRIQELEPLQQSALKKINDVLTPEQAKKKAIAAKAARKAGKKGAELQQYVMSYLDLNAKQKDRMAAAGKELHKIRLAIAREVEHLLDDNQKKQIKMKR